MVDARLSYRREAGPSGDVLRLEGDLTRVVAGELTSLLVERRPGRLTLDLSAVSGMDSAAVGALIHGWRQSRPGSELVVGPMSADAERALALFRVGPDGDKPPPPPTFTEGLGAGVYAARDGARSLLQLAADSTFALASALVRPSRLRWGALVEQCIDIGSRALGIVALITFRQFGAAIYVADLTAVSVVREMGPLMTAILVAGRSGSSIAAEVATMQVSEEIDALKVMGVDPIGFLAVPRLLGLLFVVPLLTALADVVGLGGGFLVGTLYLDLTPVAFLDEAVRALRSWDLVTGVIKSACFAYGIGLIGLFYGFRVRGGASEVGRTTTASVVASIFYIIVADCAFSVVFYILL
jgi:phospholipid/cholesterol/gamma-HCH transport system permease protein